MDEACASLLLALQSLETRLTETFPSDQEAVFVTRALAAHVSERVSALLGVLNANTPIDNAKRRLAVEAAIHKVAPEIKDALALYDLLAAAAVSAPQEIDLVDALEQRFGAPNPSAETIKIAIDVPRPAPIVADRHVLGVLIEIGASLSAKASAAPVRLAQRGLEGGTTTLRIAPVPRGGVVPKMILAVPAHGDVPFAREAARVAARLSGLHVEIDASTGAMSITSETSVRPC